MLRPFPLLAIRGIDVYAFFAQRLTVVFGVVLWPVAERGPIGVEGLEASVVRVAVDHHAAGIGVTERDVDQVCDIGRAMPGRKRALVDRPRPERADAQR